MIYDKKRDNYLSNFSGFIRIVFKFPNYIKEETAFKGLKGSREMNKRTEIQLK